MEFFSNSSTNSLFLIASKAQKKFFLYGLCSNKKSNNSIIK